MTERGYGGEEVLKSAGHSSAASCYGVHSRHEGMKKKSRDRRKISRKASPGHPWRQYRMTRSSKEVM
jgi:hypothetical protein